MGIDIKVKGFDNGIKAIEGTLKAANFVTEKITEELAAEVMSEILSLKAVSVTIDIEEPEFLMHYLFGNEEDYFLWNLNQNLPRFRGKSQ